MKLRIISSPRPPTRNTFSPWLGINLVGPADVFAGVTLNDSGDGDTGPNRLQNFPTITNAISRGPVTTISGRLNSTANRTFLVDVYRNISVAPSGYGEGQNFVGTITATTGGDGNANFTLTTPGHFAGQYFTATATDQITGDTSEFSATVLATNGPAAPAFASPAVLKGTGFTATVTLTLGQSYRVQATTNLGGNPIPWVNLTNFTAGTTNFTFLDRAATNLAARFYRVVSP